MLRPIFFSLALLLVAPHLIVVECNSALEAAYLVVSAFYATTDTLEKLSIPISTIRCGATLLLNLAVFSGFAQGSAPVNFPAPRIVQSLGSLGYGVDSGGEIINNPTAITRLKSAGAQWVRLAVYWSFIEPASHNPAVYDWTRTDSYIMPVINAGLTPVLFVSAVPGWAGPIPCGPIDTNNAALLGQFSDFMHALAGHYPQVPVWILFNEADNATTDYASHDGCFGASTTTNDINHNGVPDTTDYALMLASARDGVRQANPNAQVAVSVTFDSFNAVNCPPGYPGNCPASSTFDYNFLPALFAYIAAHPRAGNEPYADLVGFDQYDLYSPYWENRAGLGYHGIEAKAQAIRMLMQDAGVSMGLFVTQTTESSDPGWVGQDGQSQCLVTEMVRGSAAGLQGVEWWKLNDEPARGWYYGVVDGNLDPKPSFTAFQFLVQQLSGYTFDKNLSGTTIENYQFRNGAKKRLVAWSLAVKTPGNVHCADQRNPRKLTVQKATRVSITDIYNQHTKFIRDNTKRDLDPRPNFIAFKVGGVPTYITINP